MSATDYLGRCATAAAQDLDPVTGEWAAWQAANVARAVRKGLALKYGRNAARIAAALMSAEADPLSGWNTYYRTSNGEPVHIDAVEFLMRPDIGETLGALLAGPEVLKGFIAHYEKALPAEVLEVLAALLSMSADEYHALTAELVRSLLEGEHSAEHAHGRQAQHRERCPHRRRIMATANTADPDAHTLSKYGAMSSRNSNREANRRR
jgi:hypothetical protein